MIRLAVLLLAALPALAQASLSQILDSPYASAFPAALESESHRLAMQADEQIRPTPRNVVTLFESFCGGEPCRANLHAIYAVESRTPPLTGVADIPNRSDGSAATVTSTVSATSSGRSTALMSAAPALTGSMNVSQHTAPMRTSAPPDCSFVTIPPPPLPQVGDCVGGRDRAGNACPPPPIDPHAITQADMAKALDWSKGAGVWFACRSDLVRDYRVDMIARAPQAPVPPIDYYFDRGFSFPDQNCEFQRTVTVRHCDGCRVTYTYGYHSVTVPVFDQFRAEYFDEAYVDNHEVVVDFLQPCTHEAFTYRWE